MRVRSFVSARDLICTDRWDGCGQWPAQRRDPVRLIGVASPQHFDGSSQQDYKIKPKAPVVDVPEIVLYSCFDRDGCGGRTAAAMDLGPSRQSWPDPAAKGVVPHELVKFSVVSQGMRTRTHQRHAALENIQQLWQFIEACSTQPFADTGDASVDGMGLTDRGPVLKHMHRPEFADPEDPTIKTTALLPKEYGAGRIQLDRKCGHHKQRGKYRQGEPRDEKINHSLGRTVQRRKGTTLEFNANGTSKTSRRMSKQFGCRTDRHEDDWQRQDPQGGNEGPKFGPSFRVRFHHHLVELGTANVVNHASSKPPSAGRTEADWGQAEPASDTITMHRQRFRQSGVFRWRLVTDQNNVCAGESSAAQASSQKRSHSPPLGEKQAQAQDSEK